MLVDKFKTASKKKLAFVRRVSKCVSAIIEL